MIKPEPRNTRFTQINQQRSRNIGLDVRMTRGAQGSGVWKIQSQSLDGKELERENWFLNVDKPIIRKSFTLNTFNSYSVKFLNIFTHHQNF